MRTPRSDISIVYDRVVQIAEWTKYQYQAWHGVIKNNYGCIFVAAAEPVLYRFILMNIGVARYPSCSKCNPILDFTLAAHSPDTAVLSLPTAWREYSCFICL